MVGVKGSGREEKMNQANYRAESNNIQSPEGPLKQRGDETSCVCWQWDSAGATQLSASQPKPYITGHSAERSHSSTPLKGEGTRATRQEDCKRTGAQSHAEYLNKMFITPHNTKKKCLKHSEPLKCSDIKSHVRRL